LGWLGENSVEIREALLRMVLDRGISAGDRSWPAYSLFRLGGGESAVVEAMLTVLEDEAPILCGWAQGYLSNFATRSSEVVTRLAVLAEDPSRPTLPWVLAATARLSGLSHHAVKLLETIAISDPSVARGSGAIEVLVQCAQTSPEWRRRAAIRLVETLPVFLDLEPTEENLTDLASGMRALGWLRVDDPATWELCLRFLRHSSRQVREMATYGIGGLPTDEHLGTRIVAMLASSDVTGAIRGGLADALQRMYIPDQV
jgi:hypothetical protein